MSLFRAQLLSLCDALSLVTPAPHLTLRPGIQRPEFCSSGFLSPASKLDASSSLSQAGAAPLGNSAPPVHACQHPRIWPILATSASQGFRHDNAGRTTSPRPLAPARSDADADANAVLMMNTQR